MRDRSPEVVTAQNWQDMGWSARKAYQIDHEGTRGWALWAAYNNGSAGRHYQEARDAVYRYWR